MHFVRELDDLSLLIELCLKTLSAVQINGDKLHDYNAWGKKGNIKPKFVSNLRMEENGRAAKHYFGSLVSSFTGTLNLVTYPKAMIVSIIPRLHGVMDQLRVIIVDRVRLSPCEY